MEVDQPKKIKNASLSGAKASNYVKAAMWERERQDRYRKTKRALVLSDVLWWESFLKTLSGASFSGAVLAPLFALMARPDTSATVVVMGVAVGMSLATVTALASRTCALKAAVMKDNETGE